VVVVYSVPILPSKDVASRHIKFITWNLAGETLAGWDFLGSWRDVPGSLGLG